MVNILLVERILNDLRAELQELRNATDITWKVYRTNKRARRFVVRTLHILIEACIDIAQHLISDENLREPTSYRDTFVVLAENGILIMEDIDDFESMASFRNLIVHYYERVDDGIVYGFFNKRLSDFDRFVDHIVAYLEKHRDQKALKP